MALACFCLLLKSIFLTSRDFTLTLRMCIVEKTWVLEHLERTFHVPANILKIPKRNPPKKGWMHSNKTGKKVNYENWTRASKAEMRLWFWTNSGPLDWITKCEFYFSNPPIVSDIHWRAWHFLFWALNNICETCIHMLKQEKGAGGCYLRGCDCRLLGIWSLVFVMCLYRGATLRHTFDSSQDQKLTFKFFRWASSI